MTAADGLSAATAAKTSGTAVEDLSQRTATVSVLRLPDGGKVTRFYAEPVHSYVNGEWVDSDSRLVADKAGTALKPRVSSVPVTVSEGGADSQPLSDGGQSGHDLVDFPVGSGDVTVAWNGVTPTATVADNEATFPDAAPGEDIVVEQGLEHVEWSVRLKQRPESAPVLDFPVRAHGLTLVQPAGGGPILITEADGNEVGTIDSPTMLDAGDGPDARSGQVAMRLLNAADGSQTVALTPDNGFLQDAATQYPVLIDPSMQCYGQGGSSYGHACTYGTQDAYGEQSTSTTHASSALQVGELSNGHWTRSVLKFTGLSGYFPAGGDTFTGATLRLNVSGTPGTCSGTNLMAYTTTGAWSDTGVSGTSMPTYTTSPSATMGLDCATGAHAWRVDSVVSPWLSSGNPSANKGFFLQAQSEASTNYWRQYNSAENASPPMLEVYSNTPPDATNVRFPQSLGSTDGTNPDVPPGFLTQATLTDRDNDPQGISEVLNIDTNDGSSSGQVSTGQTASVAAPGLTYTTHTVKVKPVESGANTSGDPDEPGGSPVYGSYTSAITVRVDGTSLAAPSVTSTDVHRDDWISATSIPGATFTLSEGSPTPSNFNHFEYLVDGTGGWQWAVDSSGTPTFGFTAGPFNAGTHSVLVRAITNAGIGGTVTTFNFGLGVGNVGATRTWHNLILLPGGTADKNGATYSWKPKGTPDTSYQTLTASRVSLANSPSNSTCSAFSAWPATPSCTGSTWPKLVWDAYDDLGINFRGLITVKASYTSSGGGGTQDQTQTVQLDGSPFGGSYATTSTAAGELSLATGDLAATVTDASTPGYNDTMTMSRTFTTLKPGGVGAELNSNVGVASSTSNYSPTEATLSRVTTPTFTGPGSATGALQINPDGTGPDSFAAVGGDYGALRLGMLPGHTYTVTTHEYVPSATGLGLATAGANLDRGERISAYVNVNGSYTDTTSEAPTAVDTWNTLSLTFTIPDTATEAFVRLYDGSSTTGTVVYYDETSIREVAAGTTNATRVTGPGWKATLPAPSSGMASASVADNANTTGYVTFTEPDGSATNYINAGSPSTACTNSAPCTFYGAAEAAYDGSTLKQDTTTATIGNAPAGSAELILTELDGSTSTWVQGTATSGNDATDKNWDLVSVTNTGAKDKVVYAYDTQGRLTDVVSAPPSGITACTPAPGNTSTRGLVPGCRDMVFVYSPPSTALPSDTSPWGAFPGQLDHIEFWSALQGASAVTQDTTPVAQYAYDSSGHLRAAWNPHTGATGSSTNTLKTTYTYVSPGTDPAARLASVTPAGLNSYQLEYNADGTLKDVDTADPNGGSTALTQSFQYGIPLCSTSSGFTTTLPGMNPLDGTCAGANKPADWGQTADADLPYTATATYPSSHIPTGLANHGDLPYATITYINTDGRPTNTASYDGTAWQLSTTWYDQVTGNTLHTLTARARDAVLGLGSSGDPTVDAMATATDKLSALQSTNVYSNDGIDLLHSEGPEHDMVLDNGLIDYEGKSEADYTYDTNADHTSIPGSLHLLTHTTKYGFVVSGSPASGLTAGQHTDAHDSALGYGAVGGMTVDGWTLQLPTTSTTYRGAYTGPGTGNPITTTTVYDTQGRVFQGWMPADTGASSAERSDTFYYTATADSSVPANQPAACKSRDAIAGWPCETAPDATAGGTYLPVNQVTGYDRYGRATGSTTTVNGVVKSTTATTLDPAGRVTASSITDNTGAASSGTHYTKRDVSSGLVTCVSSATGCTGTTVLTSYDSGGRVTSSTDASANVATTTYDSAGRVTQVAECKGTSCATFGSTTSYGYADGTDTYRGLVTSINANLGAGTQAMTATYNADGNITSQTYPNGTTVARWLYDSTDSAYMKTYSFGSCTGCWTDKEQADAMGQGIWSVNNNAAVTYAYDNAGRLSTSYEQDSTFGSAHVLKRQYYYDANSNRTSETVGDTGDRTLTAADNPSAWWHFDETTGLLAADSKDTVSPSYTNDFTWTGTGFTHQAYGINPEVTNGSLASNSGNSVAATTANNPADRLTGSAWTLELWVNVATPASGTYPTILSRSSAATAADGWKLYAAPDQSVHLTKGGSDIQIIGAADGTWHQVFVTFDGTTERAGRDGVQTATATPSFVADTSAVGLSLGGSGSSTKVDELAIYPTALTVDRLAYHVQAARNGSYTNSHTYNTADQITTSGYTYDSLERTTTLPSVDAGGTGTVTAGLAGNTTLRYYDNSMVCAMGQGSAAKAYTLDPLMRIQQTTTGTGLGTGCAVTGTDATQTTTQHYDDSASGGSESAAWIEGATSWTRNVEGLDGNLAGQTTGTGATQSAITLVLTDLQGSIIGTTTAAANATPGPMLTSTEFGISRPQTDGTGRPNGGTGADKYGWLGGKRRDTDAVANLTLMGERLYNPALGRFLTTDPVPGGSCNDYDYVCQDPINNLDLNGQWCLGVCWHTIKHVASQTARVGARATSAASTVVGAVPFCEACTAGAAALGTASAGLYASTGDWKAAGKQLASTATSAAMGFVGGKILKDAKTLNGARKTVATVGHVYTNAAPGYAAGAALCGPNPLTGCGSPSSSIGSGSFSSLSSGPTSTRKGVYQ